MHKYVIMGVQGCGKGTQAKLLCKDFALVHIAVGDIFRWHVQQHTKLAARIQRIMNAGQLVPDDIVIEIMRRRLEEHDWNYGFILDGFPRNRPQAEFFLEGYDIDAVIHVYVPDDVVVQRIVGRRLCSACGRDWNVVFQSPPSPETCECGGQLKARPDDNETAVRSRLADYHDKTEPVLEMFRKKDTVIDADGTQSPTAVQAEIRQKLGL
ncbi:MAG: nucleoside monophosphate kinase [Planctomycetota bacterium]|nr:nucleoside monophosphate kinase [Planctomycetota bacterium]